MSKDVHIATGTDASRAFVASVERAMAFTARINRLAHADAPQVRDLFTELTARAPGPGFRLVPPFYTDHGANITVGSRVFINQGCTIYDLADVTIGDDVLIGPHVSLITSKHPVAPSLRRSLLVGRPIHIGDHVWLAAGATVIGGVTVGENSVVAAGSVVTHDVPPNVLVAGNPARIVRSIEGE